MSNIREKLRQELFEIEKGKEAADKKLLNVEILVGVLSVVDLLAVTFLAALVSMPILVRICLLVFGVVLFMAGMVYCISIEQKAGYYECEKCHHQYVPKYQSVLWAMHVNRTRYMKCPKCGKWSWQKKTIKKKKQSIQSCENDGSV